MSDAHFSAHNIATQLIALLGASNVELDRETCEFYSNDLSNERLELIDLVIRPGSTEELAASVRTLVNAGFNIVPRGGGMSYTMGYLPARCGSVAIDLRRLNRIVEINRDDRYVVVEAGVTWSQLHEALKDTGVRPGFWGPLSGLYATVGGSLSQDAALYGSGIYGTAAHNVQGLEVVLTNGEIMRTGSWAHRLGTPFFRYYGPDLTGLFVADCGAFGIKARAALSLVRAPNEVLAASFGFETFKSMVNAQISICRLGVVSECIGFDPQVNAGFEAMGFSFTEGVELLSHVVKSRANLLRGTLAAFKIVRAGKRVLRNVEYSLHVIAEGRDIRTISADISEARDAAISNGGWSIKNAIPTAMRARPFGPLRQNLLGPDGQLWMPLHSFFPLSKANAAVAATLQFLAENKTTLTDRGISTSCVTATAATHFMIEPSFYWQDSLGTLRLSMIEPEFQEKWRDRPANQETRATVLKLRRELAAVYSAIGGTQQQIGKFYALQSVLQPATWRTLEAIKRALDPDDRMNPGSLGLGTTAQ